MLNKHKSEIPIFMIFKTSPSHTLDNEYNHKYYMCHSLDLHTSIASLGIENLLHKERNNLVGRKKLQVLGRHHYSAV